MHARPDSSNYTEHIAGQSSRGETVSGHAEAFVAPVENEEQQNEDAQVDELAPALHPAAVPFELMSVTWRTTVPTFGTTAGALCCSGILALLISWHRHISVKLYG